MTISKSIEESMKASSWIRTMFEEGERLKKIHGAENIFDFTLGNPVMEPPEELKDELARIVSSDARGLHRYMTNSGYEDVREQIAEFYRERTQLPFSKDHIIMTVGSAGGMNVALKAILDPADEVIVPCPYFVEFKFYIENHGGVMKLVQTGEDFHLDIGSIAEAITDKTKAVIVNSPHNPTGVVYTEEELKELANLLTEKMHQGQRIYIISDEAYRKIIYEGRKYPDIFGIYQDTISVTSHSKDLALPGERIGYVAVSPLIEGWMQCVDAMIFTNRILGFINAPAMMQRLVAKFQKNSVNITDYQKKRDKIYDILKSSGFDVIKPDGAFYVFPKSPFEDDVQFIRYLQKHHILGVPGTGFGKRGHFRLAYCVEDDVIDRSRKYFEEVGKEVFSRS